MTGVPGGQDTVAGPSGPRPRPAFGSAAIWLRQLRLCLVAVIAASIIGATLLTLAAQFHWIADLAANFRLHLLAISIVAMPVLWVLRARMLAILLLGCVLLHGWSIARPIAGPAASIDGEATSISLISFNIQLWHEQQQRVIDFLAAQQADIVVIQEGGRRWAELIRSLDDFYPYRAGQDGRGRNEFAILSRFPLSDVGIERLGDGIPGTVLRAVADIRGTDVVLFAVHPHHPISDTLWRRRNLQFDTISVLFAEDAARGPVIVAGDFNSTPWSPFYDSALERSGLADAAGTRMQAATRRPDWPVSWAWLGIPIDHVWVSPEIAVRSYEVGPELGSDHLPVMVDLDIPKG